MMKAITLGTALLLAACSGGADDDEPEGFTCSILTRTGTYLMTLTEVDGTCGELPSSVVRLDLSGELDPGCALDKPTVISPDECSVESSMSCTDEFGFTTKMVGTTKQANRDGSLITGIASLYASDDLGPICSGTYRIRAERQ